MSKRLYRVEVTFLIYAWAECEEDAIDLVDDGIQDGGATEKDIFVDFATLESLRIDNWSDSLPYGQDEDEDELTCAERLASVPAAPEDDRDAAREKAAWDAHPKLPLEAPA